MKVTSLDGRISCDGSCTVDVTLGDRIAFAVEKKPGVLATLGFCDRPGGIASAPCFFTVVPVIVGSRETNPAIKVVTRATPVQSAVVASNPQGLSTSFGIAGDWVAVSILFAGNATTFQLDDVTFPVTGSFQSLGLAMVNRSTKSSLFLALPSASPWSAYGRARRAVGDRLDVEPGGAGRGCHTGRRARTCCPSFT